MLADFFTKPLQGSLFHKFRDVVLGYKHIDALTQSVPISTEERVENRVETDTDDAPDETRKKDTKNHTTNHVETTNAVDHGTGEDKNSDDERWITVTGKRKPARFQDMGDRMTAH